MRTVLTGSDWKFTAINSFVEFEELQLPPGIAESGPEWFSQERTVLSWGRAWTNFVLTAKTEQAEQMLGSDLLYCRFELNNKSYLVSRILGFPLGPTISVQCNQLLIHHG